MLNPVLVKVLVFCVEQNKMQSLQHWFSSFMHVLLQNFVFAGIAGVHVYCLSLENITVLSLIRYFVSPAQLLCIISILNLLHTYASSDYKSY